MPAQAGRPIPDNTENITWTTRILKEEAVNARVNPDCFSVRSAMRVADVPDKFKVGHMDPRQAVESQGFDPRACGWDPQGKEAKEFRKTLDGQSAGPRTRHAYPETSSHELGWLLAPAGRMAERVERKRGRVGVGWPGGPPAAFSEVSTVPPGQAFYGSEISAVSPTELSMVAPSGLSQAVPTELSRSSAQGAPRGERVERSGGSQLNPAAPTRLGTGQAARARTSELARAGASQVSGTAPDRAQPSRSKSLPALGGTKGAIGRLRHQEAVIEKAMEESREYLNKGSCGKRWTRFSNGTDVTEFDNEFAKRNGGVPLYKMASR